MTYKGIDKRKFGQLLASGTHDEELRSFFLESRSQLIQKGARVQNLPHGTLNRIRVLTSELPPATDKIVQAWFSKNLTMLDPEPIGDAVEMLRMYEDVGENVPLSEAKRLARSCLVSLFSAEPPQVLLDYLTPQKNGHATSGSEQKEKVQSVEAQHFEWRLEPLAHTLIDLVNGRDPDDHLHSLPPPAGALIAGIHAARKGNQEEVRAALEALSSELEVKSLLADFAAKASAASNTGEPRGLQIMKIPELENPKMFDAGRDDVMAVCTKDFPENAVFVRPFAVRSEKGVWNSLAINDIREQIFFTSGDVMVFHGRDKPRQPKRGEIGIWRVAQNDNSSPTHRTNFHVVSEKAPVYDVREVPFASAEFDSVREYIKHQAELLNAISSKTLFLLRDG